MVCSEQPGRCGSSVAPYRICKGGHPKFPKRVVELVGNAVSCNESAARWTLSYDP